MPPPSIPLIPATLASATQIPRQPQALYLSHGGGPMPVLGDAGHHELVTTLKTLPALFDKPSAIILISAHWEDDVTAVTHLAAPPMLYDYYGFPEPAYQLQYPAPGAPALAETIHAALGAHGVASRLEERRGFDHGLYIPLMLMYPQADIPCVQVSLQKNLDAATHITMGHALTALAQNGVLLIGSGFSFHNMQAFFAPPTPVTRDQNKAFENWLHDTCTNPGLTETERTERLVNWAQAPAARFCHPREEHLLPVHVCYGAAQRPANAAIALNIIGKQASMYLW